MSRLLPLGEEITRAAQAAGLVGAKAARLARAARAGLAVLPGWVVPVAEGRPALSAGVAAVRQGRPAAARRAVLGCRLDDALAAELREAVAGLSGRVIVRSSSPLEGDPRWSGAFSSVAEVGPDDAVPAVRSCWASAFAVDPLGRLEACGLPPEALELGVLIQPEIRPVAGGVARVTPAPDGAAGVTPAADGAARVTRAADGAAVEVTVEGVPGHPGALLSGWVEGASAHIRFPWEPPAQSGLARLIGPETVAAVADLAVRAWRLLGDDVIEWAAGDGEIWLLQSRCSGGTAGRATAERATGEQVTAGLATTGWVTAGRVTAGQFTAGQVTAEPARAGERAATGLPAGGGDGGLPTGRAWMPLLAATVLGRGEHVPGRPGAPGMAAGRLLACRPHEPPDGDCADAILLLDQPLPALAPLLFAARGVIARTGAAGSHLAEVARSLGVPMVLGCRPERVIGGPPVPDGGFLAAIDGSTGDVAFLPATEGG